MSSKEYKLPLFFISFHVKMAVPKPETWLLRAEKFLPNNSLQKPAAKPRKPPVSLPPAEAVRPYEYENIGELLAKKVPPEPIRAPKKIPKSVPSQTNPAFTQSRKKSSPKKKTSPKSKLSSTKKPSAQKQAKPEPKVKPVKEPKVRMPKDVVMPRF